MRGTSGGSFWKSFWDSYPRRAAEREYLRQVGKTVGGMEITREQFDTIVEDIENHLELTSSDVVLDLCCGNGLITRELARKCDQVVGVDFSRPLIEQARKITAEQNVRYISMDVKEIARVTSLVEGPFSKVLWYEALQFFDEREFRSILAALRDLTTGDVSILIGSVLDHDRKWRFFDTPKRRLQYAVKLVLLRREVGLGKWWRRSEIERVCRQCGFACDFKDQSELLHTSHYRIDVKLYPLHDGRYGGR
ncbi:MAG TPA: class I SAM-dependent methyltransferase [Anaerolineae bacterium]|nr:class I SAM-dependent methyltransferase [Anaerolineae bacterium]